jgi:hypothetical protein
MAAAAAARRACTTSALHINLEHFFVERRQEQEQNRDGVNEERRDLTARGALGNTRHHRTGPAGLLWRFG